MSFEALNHILKAEQSARDAYQETTILCKQMLQDAEAAEKAKLLQAQTEAALEAKGLLREAETQGEKARDGILLHGENQCAVLRARAETKLPQAVNLIIERIVKS